MALKVGEAESVTCPLFCHLHWKPKFTHLAMPILLRCSCLNYPRKDRFQPGEQSATCPNKTTNLYFVIPSLTGYPPNFPSSPPNLSLRDLTKDKSWQSQNKQAERLLRYTRKNICHFFVSCLPPLIPAQAGTFLCCSPVFSSPFGDNLFSLVFPKCWVAMFFLKTWGYTPSCFTSRLQRECERASSLKLQTT